MRQAPHRAKKSLGQNFLSDPNIARKIVEAMSILEDDTVIEIGPGKGALTALLGAKNANIIAVEKDNQLCISLKHQLFGFSNLNIIHNDFLKYVIPSEASRVKVVGNIPYNLTSKIVSRLVDERRKIDYAILMVQEEVAERLSAHTGTKEFGSISIRLQLVAGVRKLFPVAPTCFQPRPKVNSRVIKIVFKEREPLIDENEFVDFVKKAFGMRRKMFRHYAAHFYGKESIDLLPEKFRTNRIETFTPEEIYRLFLILEKNV
ncbi:MAG: 16S rRNA (adenine(1518)-N(6)/adenine(1519)-N(6))-dimethyltransferase RsmA [Candidatus Kryptoniota bacterium]